MTREGHLKALDIPCIMIMAKRTVSSDLDDGRQKQKRSTETSAEMAGISLESNASSLAAEISSKSSIGTIASAEHENQGNLRYAIDKKQQTHDLFGIGSHLIVDATPIEAPEPETLTPLNLDEITQCLKDRSKTVTFQNGDHGAPWSAFRGVEDAESSHGLARGMKPRAILPRSAWYCGSDHRKRRF